MEVSSGMGGGVVRCSQMKERFLEKTWSVYEESRRCKWGGICGIAGLVDEKGRVIETGAGRFGARDQNHGVARKMTRSLGKKRWRVELEEDVNDDSLDERQRA